MPDEQGSSARNDSGVDIAQKALPENGGQTQYQFSKALQSRTIKIITSQGAEFYVHEELLCRESDRFERQLKGDFKEAKTGEITDFDECPELLGMFFEYLYRQSFLWDSSLSSGWEMRILARLYCLAERLCAKSFQDAVFRKFSHLFHGKYTVPDLEVFETLVICHTELPERKDEDYPMRRIALWWTASRLSGLKKTPIFKKTILDHYPELGSQLLLLAEPGGSAEKPQYPTVESVPRFTQEIKFAKRATDSSLPE
ncbi:hypothetical protein HDK64DRAFT_301074 [Phyllosticta capitalensis]